MMSCWPPARVLPGRIGRGLPGRIAPVLPGRIGRGLRAVYSGRARSDRGSNVVELAVLTTLASGASVSAPLRLMPAR